MAPPLSVLWLRCEKTGRRFPLAVFTADTDFANMGWGSLTSLLRHEVVVAACTLKEQKEPNLLESRINGILEREDLRVAPLVRAVDNNKGIPKGLSFPEYRKRYRHPTVYFKDIFTNDGEAVVIEEMSPEDFVSGGGVILNVP